MFDDRSRPWLGELNPEQRMAVTHQGGPLLVLAGAGTGKTTTLCARVAWLLTEGVPAERVLLLTFTRRAAREMIERARSMAKRALPGAGQMVGGTFHSLAHRMVRLHASSLALPPGFGVLDAADATDLLDLVRQEQGHAAASRRFPRAQTMLDIYSRTVNSQRPVADHPRPADTEVKRAGGHGVADLPLEVQVEGHGDPRARSAVAGAQGTGHPPMLSPSAQAGQPRGRILAIAPAILRPMTR